MSSSNLSLLEAFPQAVRADALIAISGLPEVSTTSHAFSVSVGPEVLTIPYRIYHDPSLIRSKGLTRTQGELLACLLTRHHDGFVREQQLRSVLASKSAWVPPFVIQLVGENVIEIINEIRDNLDQLSPGAYGSFLRQNADFYQLIQERVLSYWNCYHRDQQRADYAGFQVLEAFDRFGRSIL
jgi:hypothetical protein